MASAPGSCRWDVEAYCEQALLHQLRGCFGQASAHQTSEGRHVSWLLPQARGKERGHETQISGWQWLGAELDHLAEDLEDVRVEFLHRRQEQLQNPSLMVLMRQST